MVGQEDRNAPSPLDILQAENARLREENEAYARNLRGKHAITGATYEHLIQERDRLRAELAAAQAVIEQMRGVIGAWERADGNEELQEAEAKLIKAMNATANLDALHEALAQECERLAKTHGVGVMKWLCEEAAAHRARKQATKEEGK